MIVRPALAKPTTVLTSVVPADIAENTIKSRVCAVTGIASPVTIPLLTVPTATGPVSAGASVTAAPATGVKVLLGVGDEYN